MDKDLERELRNRVQFYRELGFESFYRRNAASPAPVEKEPARGQAAAGARTWLPGAAAAAGPQAPARGLPVEAVPAAPPSAVSLFESRPPEQVNPKLTRAEKLAVIQSDLGDCRRCKLHAGRKTIVFGSGNPDAEVVFVGEGPGADEDEQGLPFVGRAGQLLTEMINNSAERMKLPLRREQVYICNVVKCRPPGNRAPERDETETCSPFLLRQLEAIRPRAIVALGSTAVRALLNSSEPMTRLRGRWFDFRGSRLLVTYHPAYLLRDPSKKREAWQDMQMLLRFLYGKN